MSEFTMGIRGIRCDYRTHDEECEEEFRTSGDYPRGDLIADAQACGWFVGEFDFCPLHAGGDQ